jgi:guanine deaminase
MTEEEYMRLAIELGLEGMRKNEGGPFGAVIVYGSKIIGRGNNKVTSTNDPTAHAEIVAIRDACKNINNFQLKDCDIYISCEPCPMCLAAIYWARISKIYYAVTKNDVSKHGFDDDYIYKELNFPKSKRKILMKKILRDDAIKNFDEWDKKKDKIQY